MIDLAETTITATLSSTMSPTGHCDDTHPEASLPERSVDATLDASCPLLAMQLPAEPVAPSVARHRVGRWLTGLSWPPGQREDIVLALSEAVSNAAEHAYRDRAPGVIDIYGKIERAPDRQRWVTIIVRDHGRWRPTPINDENRRRGIPLMRACMDTVTIEHSDGTGTQVVLRSRTVPPPAF